MINHTDRLRRGNYRDQATFMVRVSYLAGTNIEDRT